MPPDTHTLPSDMEQSLIEHLNEKLSQLERKLQAYRHDLVCEFQRHYKETIQSTDASGAARVSQTIVQSLHERYPGLGQGLELEQVIVHVNGTGSRSDSAESHLLDAGANRAGPQPKGAADNNISIDPVVGSRSSSRSIIAGSTGTGSISFHQLPPPQRAAVFGAAVAGERPHERETEFHGLFTPFFLPLLESSPNISVPASPTSPVPIAVATSSHEPATAGFGIGAGIDKGTDMTGIGSADSHSPPTQLVRQGQLMEGQIETRQGLSTPQAEIQPRSESPWESPETPQVTSPEASQGVLSELRPHHSRRDTGDTSSTVLSDKSDTKVRRSALRRSSSASKSLQSPRRVRFEVRGAEVLPTASPQASDIVTPRPASPISSDRTRTFDEVAGDNSSEDAFFQEVSLPPRKISSSEALRAMSRAPLDEGTVWTVVNAEADESSPARSEQPPSPSRFSMSTSRRAPTPKSTEAVQAQQRLAAISVAQPPEPAEDSGSSSEDDFLSIGRTKTHKPTALSRPETEIRSPPGSQESHAEASQLGDGIKPQPLETSRISEEDKDHASSDDFDAEDDGMFHFDTGGLSAPPRPKKPPPPTSEESPETSPPGSPIRHSNIEDSYATSPAVPITRPVVSSGSSTPTTSKFQLGSLGSYKGRPVVMPVIKNPELHAQAESLGQFNTFVGGLDGRSGMDDGDLNSFRASLVQSSFSGAPRSLTERMMMEDQQLERNSQR